MSTTEKAKNALNQIVELFKTGNVPEKIALATLSADIPSKKWSLCNRLLQMIGDTCDARGFKQWAEVNRQVVKGSKAIYILAPMLRKIAAKEDTEEKTICIGFRAVPVFRVEDTEGDPLPYQKQEPPILLEVAEKFGLKVKFIPFLSSYYGYYSQKEKEIALASPDASVFFHELAHAAHDRIENGLKPGQDSKQEIVAELTAAVLCSMYGKTESMGFSYKYVESYAKRLGKTVEQACVSLLSTVDKVLHEILQYQDQNQIA
jgi:hypothetical protein